jgi:hypothetical protein
MSRWRSAQFGKVGYPQQQDHTPSKSKSRAIHRPKELDSLNDDQAQSTHLSSNQKVSSSEDEAIDLY